MENNTFTVENVDQAKQVLADLCSPQNNPDARLNELVRYGVTKFTNYSFGHTSLGEITLRFA